MDGQNRIWWVVFQGPGHNHGGVGSLHEAALPHAGSACQHRSRPKRSKPQVVAVAVVGSGSV